MKDFKGMKEVKGLLWKMMIQMMYGFNGFHGLVRIFFIFAKLLIINRLEGLKPSKRCCIAAFALKTWKNKKKSVPICEIR
jgi:hypothetical protein